MSLHCQSTLKSTHTDYPMNLITPSTINEEVYEKVQESSFKDIESISSVRKKIRKRIKQRNNYKTNF